MIRKYQRLVIKRFRHFFKASDVNIGSKKTDVTFNKKIKIIFRELKKHNKQYLSLKKIILCEGK